MTTTIDDLAGRAPRKRVLLTGATGFLGGAFLAHPRESDDIEWILPARGSSDAEARQRVWRRLNRFVGEARAARILQNATVIRADLTTPDALTAEMLEGVTHVVHLAANTSFIAKKGVWEMNFVATGNLARTLRRVRTLERFVYVGTAMICGDRPSGNVLEDSYPADDAQHLIPYTESKAAAEQMLIDDFADLPVIVARPSIVVGHTKLGCAPSGSIYWVVRALERVRLLSGELDATLDVVPVDYVAQALDHLTFATRLRYQTYHISAGAESSVPVRRLAEALASQRTDVSLWSDYQVIRSLDVVKYKHRFVEMFGSVDGRRVLRALGLYLRFCELNVRFDNRRLREEGLPAAPTFLDYLEACSRQSSTLSVVAQADDEI